MHKLLHTLLTLSSRVKSCGHSPNSPMSNSRLGVIVVLLIFALFTPFTVLSQASANWNYVTRSGSIGTTYSWINCSAGTTIIAGDDDQASFNWPFNFTFYNNAYTTSNSLSVTTNGFIRLDGIATTNASTAKSYDLISAATNLGQIIGTSIYDCGIGTSGGYIKYLVTGSAPNRILTIEYNNTEIDYNDGKYADVQVSFYESLNKVVIKQGAENINLSGVDVGIHSGVSGYFHKWQEIRSGADNMWIEYTTPLLPPAASWNYVSQTGTLGNQQNWIDCSTGTSIVTGDDAVGSVSWPFNFSFYDNSYNPSKSLSVSANGFIRLDGPASTDYSAANNLSLSATSTQLGQIIAMSVYDNQVGGSTSSWCRYLVTGSAPYRTFTIEYNNIQIPYNGGVYADVQVSFLETLNDIVLKYGNDNISTDGVDMGVHSGVNGYFNKWQEASTGTNNSWIKYTRAVEVNATNGTMLANYSTIKEAFDKINDGTHKGAITLKVNASTIETASAVLNASGSGSASYTLVNVYPTITGVSISGNMAAPLIDLNGVDNVTIDGRVNATGTSVEMVITNTSTSAIAGTSTLRFINDATGNTVKYCNVKGSGTAAGSGVLFFSTTTSGLGNDNNIISNNNISSSSALNRPVNAIFSLGTSGKDNSSNTIINNNVYDFIKHGTTSNGILLSLYTSSWSITGNSFYETTSFVPSGAAAYNAIQINNTSGNGFIISGNYLGGSAPECGGSQWTKTGSNNNIFNAISLNVGSSTASSIQNNVIRAFNWINSGNSAFTAINIQGGSVNIGTINGNVIGSTTGTGSITLTSGATGSNMVGISIAGSSDVICEHNSIGSITSSNANAAYASNIFAISISNTGTIDVSHNTIGSVSQANSIHASSPSSANAQSVHGIVNTAGTLIIEDNIISNLTNGTTNPDASSLGVVNAISSTGGLLTILDNEISNLTSNNANNSSSHTASASGIALTGTGTKIVSNNTIYNLSNTYASFEGSVIGLYFGSTGTANTVNANFIHDLSVTGASSTGGSVYGIKIVSGQTTYSNNIISLGGNSATTLHGIYETGTAGNNNSILFNTIYIGGTPGTGIANKSYALFSAVSTNTRDFRNNIFMNSRSTTGGVSLHYCLYVVTEGGSITSDFNDYHASGTGGVLGYYGSDMITLPVVTGQDINSTSINPGLASAGATAITGYYSSTVLNGTTIAGITIDYNELVRGTSPKMGALEDNQYVWQGSLSTDFATAGNWTGGVVPPQGADIAFAASPSNHCLLDQNRIIKKLTNAQSTYDLVVNGWQLMITGSMVLSNGAQIDATASSSIIHFTGTTVQIIPTGAFVNNTIDGLNVNNNHGLTLNGILTISTSLILTSGAFSIGANTLILNGSIVSSAGSLTGGNNSNIYIGGNGPSTSLPSVTLNNLTIDRASGITLSGAASVNGTLVLTNGVLSTGANTLTFSGSSPTRTSGAIDASNASAILSFTGTTAFVLPASIFSSSIQNLSINTSGGVTAGSGFTVNGALNLQSANPTAVAGTLNMLTHTLDLGSEASVNGSGDVTGITRRTTIIANKNYSFSNQFASITLPNVGTLPSQISLKTTLGNAPAWKTGSANRSYEVIQSGGSGTKAVLRTHYLDSELNGNDESKIVNWSFRNSISMLTEHGRSNFNTDDNWIEISNVDLAFFPSTFGVLEFAIDESELTSLTWNGSTSSSWVTATNWTPTGAPSDNTIIIIPDAATTVNDPILPAFSACGTITLENGALLYSETNAQLTLNGASGVWSNNGGSFNPQFSTVIFTNPAATISGTSDFFNLTINSGASLTVTSGSVIRIGGELSNLGLIDVDLFENTVEYNGADQNVINPNGLNPGYHNLILSGSGIKTIQLGALTIHGSFSTSDSANVVAAGIMSVAKNVYIGDGSTFSTGDYDHYIGGNFINNGIFNTSPGKKVTFNGTSPQSISGTTKTVFSYLDIENILGVSLLDDIDISGSLNLNSGYLAVGGNTLGIKGVLTRTSGVINLTDLSSLYFGGIDSITMSSAYFSSTPSMNDLTINRTGGVTFACDITVNGQLNLQSANPTATKGSLDLFNGDSLNILTMGALATTIGIGDVTGIVKRTTILPTINYSFGHKYTTVMFPNIGTLPSEISVKIIIGTAPSWKPGASKRVYDVIQTGALGTLASITSHYLDSELNGNQEEDLVDFSYITAYGVIEQGRSNINTTENWLAISSVDFAFFTSSFGNIEIGKSASELTSLTWNGSLSTSWLAPENWTPIGAPSDSVAIIIPSSDSTLNDPALPDFSSSKSITLESGAILNAVSSAELTLNGASGVWSNLGGTFNAGSSTIILTHAEATIIGTTNFNNLTINSGAALLLTTGSITRISGALTNNGILRAVFNPNTIEYNGGDQTVINPNGMTPGYQNLILSGTGNKTMPVTSLDITGDFSTSGTVNVAADEMVYFKGNLFIGTGTTLTTGHNDHLIGGDFVNYGTFTPASGCTFKFIGTSAQSIGGSSTTTFSSLFIDNSFGVDLTGDVSINNLLTLSSGALRVGAVTLGINGSINQLSNNVEVTPLSSLSFGGSDPITVPGNLFSTVPSINNLTINRTGGVTIGTDININGLLHLQSANPSDIKGSLDMFDGSVTKTVFMGPLANTAGVGDVTGIVTINQIIANTTYTLGSQFTTVTFPAVGVLPTSMSMKLSIGAAPSWKPTAIKRIYDVIQTGGSGTQAVIVAHYLDSELNANNEDDLVDWSYRIASGTYTEHGRSSHDITDNWIALSNVNIAFFAPTFGSVQLSLSPSELSTLTWNGSVSTSWITADNWTPLGAPSDNVSLIIPDATTTPRDPVLPAFSICKSVTLQAGSIVNSESLANLTLKGTSGAWSNIGGTFNASSSTVYFTNANASIIGTTDFNNITINIGASLTMATGSITGIVGVLTNNGTINTAQFVNTIKYNGANQDILFPNGINQGYYNLVLGGSGTKTLPNKDMVINGDLTIQGTVTTLLDHTLDLVGDLLIEDGATFNTSSLAHYISGDFINDGTFNDNGGVIILDGTIQAISGTSGISFNDLQVSPGSITTAATPGHSIKGILTCNGTLEAAGNLTLVSTSSQTALINGEGTGTITGNLVIQRYMSSGFGYKYFSSPFQAATVNEFADDLDLGTTFPSFYRYEQNRDTAWWFNHTSGSNLLAPMNGYAVNFGSSTLAITADMAGVVSNGPMSINLYNHNRPMTQGFNLVGNPYPSPIDWDASSGWSRANVDNAVYYFNSGSTDQYVGSYSTYINGVSSDGVANNIIPAMQGFFVHVTNGTYPVSGTLGFSNEVRINTLNATFHKNAFASEVSTIRMSAAFEGLNAPADPLVIMLDNNASNYFNHRTDAIKLMNTDPNITSFYTLMYSTPFTIKSVPPVIDSMVVIPLGVKIMKQGIVNFSLISAELLNPWLKIYLRDNKNRAIIDVSQSDYSVFLEEGTLDNRFSLLLSLEEMQTNSGSSNELVAYYNEGKLFVYLDLAVNEIADLQVSDMLGRIVHRQSVNGTGYYPVTLNLKHGIYVVTVKSVNSTASKKIIIPQ